MVEDVSCEQQTNQVTFEVDVENDSERELSLRSWHAARQLNM